LGSPIANQVVGIHKKGWRFEFFSELVMEQAENY